MTHELKILPKWFEDVMSGRKNFEIRRNDRDFNVGDILLLKEYEKGRYTGREITRSIKYIYKGDGTYGLSEDFCIIGLQEHDVLFLTISPNIRPELRKKLRQSIIKQMEDPTAVVMMSDAVKLVNPNKECVVIESEELNSGTEALKDIKTISEALIAICDHECCMYGMEEAVKLAEKYAEEV